MMFTCSAILCKICYILKHKGGLIQMTDKQKERYNKMGLCSLIQELKQISFNIGYYTALNKNQDYIEDMQQQINYISGIIQTKCNF